MAFPVPAVVPVLRSGGNKTWGRFETAEKVLIIINEHKTSTICSTRNLLCREQI